MDLLTAPHVPPCCPAPHCSFHRLSVPGWSFVRIGCFPRSRPPWTVQRYRCCHCGRRFSDQTFRTTYWLKRPDLLPHIFHQLLACAAYRQIARHYRIAPATVLTHAARLGRHCLLFHLHLRPHHLEPSVALDSFITFEYSQFYPTAFHLVAGSRSHFFYGFTDSELRRSGRMTPAQRSRRAQLEARLGRPHPRSTEHQVLALLQLLAPRPQPLLLHTDEHHDYPRALRHLRHLHLSHHVTSSRAPRTRHNPLFPVNLLDLLIRHSGANHKRETIAFSKRRQSAAERLWVLLVWRNYIKSFSEQKRDATPAMRLGLLPRALTLAEVLARRLFPGWFRVPERWMAYYRREVPTRRIPNGSLHRLRYLF